MKKYIFYILAATYFGGLCSNILFRVIETHWIAMLLGVFTSFLLGVTLSQIAILHDKIRLLKIRTDTSDYLNAMQNAKDPSQHFRTNETLERLHAKMNYLDEQLKMLTQPAVRRNV